MAELGTASADETIDLAIEPDFNLGTMSVRPAQLMISVGDDVRELQPRVMQVLVALAKVRPAVLSRETLAERCWEGRIVGDDALNRCIVALRHLAHEFVPAPFTIETVPRVGYFMAGKSDTQVRAAPIHPVAKRTGLVWAAVLVVLLSLLAIAWTRFSRPSEPASIAVLPFRNLSSGDPSFAAGVSEEISGQLAREPAFRVAGSASTALFSVPTDPRKVGRDLNVDYVLEGSVRPGQGRVRVYAALIRTRDGRRMWSDTFERKLDDILEIQSAIGRAVASGLKRNLIHSTVDRARPVNGEAYSLYLAARGLLRDGNPETAQDAVNLLHRSIRLDPNFAPAWSSLAEGLKTTGSFRGNEGLVETLPTAQDAARKALRLDPNLADAHAIYANLLGSDTPVGLAHLQRAAALDSRSSQGNLWAGAAHFVAGEYPEGMAAYHRAHDLDVAWALPVRVLVDVMSGMGDRRGAEAMVRNGFRDDPMLQEFALGRVAWLSGDFSEAARRWSIVAGNAPSRWTGPAKLSLEDTLFLLKLSANPPSRPPRPFVGQNRQGPRVWMTDAPSPAEWRERNATLAAALVNHDLNVVAAKRMIATGRSRELVASYYGSAGLLYMRPGIRMGVCDLHEAALVALALRDSGRRKESDALLREADILLAKAYARGTVPTWFDEDAAAIWAAQGKSGQAIDALDRALHRGAAHVGRTDLPTLAEEPVFRDMRHDPRFEVLLRKYAGHFARERIETAKAVRTASS